MGPTFRPPLSTCETRNESAFCYKELTKVLDPPGDAQVEKTSFFVFIFFFLMSLAVLTMRSSSNFFTCKREEEERGRRGKRRVRE